MMRLPDHVAARAVSCDVFDTLLYRDHRSESRRVGHIATLAAKRLASECHIVRSADEIWRTRVTVQRHAYRALDLSNPNGDVRFADMIDATARLLGLDTAAARILHEAELAIERTQLSANRALLDWLALQARAGRRILAVSDTYHRAETIRDLLAALAPGNPIEGIHTSADHNATKRTGTLFGRVLEAESLAPSEVLHLGDDHRADVEMAAAAGLQTYPLPRPGPLIARRRADAVGWRVVRALRTLPRWRVPA